MAEIGKRIERVHRAKFVHMRQHGADAARPGLKPVETQQRIEPDQPPAGTVQPVNLMFQQLVVIALQPVGDEQDDGALPQHPARPFAIELVQGRPDPRAAKGL